MILFMKPAFKQTIWGGRRLKDEYGYDIPGDDTGEAWLVSAHENGDCEILTEGFRGQTLSGLWNSHRELFGNLPGERFPLLIKIIDAEEDLSIQVHPDDRYAELHENGASGKTECWYVLDCKEEAGIVIGHNAGSPQEVREMVENGRWSDFIRVVPVKKGDFFQIEPGCVHAIRRGTLILETQQNSDITYRVYDYDRLRNGEKRPLHVQKSLDVITAPFVPADPFTDEIEREETDGDGAVTVRPLVRCRYYGADKIVLDGTETLLADYEVPFLTVTVIDGEGTVEGQHIGKGDCFVATYGGTKLEFEGNLTMIISWPVEI